MQLYITEKPSVAKALVEYFNKNGGEFKINKERTFYLDPDQDATITWSIGHILALYEPKKYTEDWGPWNINTLPMIPPNYEFKKFVYSNYESRYKVIKNLIGTATTIIHCGDPDREGQALIDEILDTVNTKKIFVKRLLLNALDDKSIKDALMSIKDNSQFKGLYNAANARAYLDWLIGMNLSRFYTCIGRAGGLTTTLSVGRVKTPTLALIVNREREIRNFKERKFWTLQPALYIDQTPIMAALDPNTQFDSVSEAESSKQILEGKTAIVSEVQEKTVISEIKELHNLDTLQIEASKRYGFTPKETLDILQKLYEKKLTTYPRSDCKFLPESQASDAAIIIANLNKSGFLPATLEVPDSRAYDKPKPYNDKKITAHHAIIPTINPAENLAENELKIYKIIAEKYASMYMPPYTYNQQTVLFEVKDTDLKLKINIKNVTEPGYKVLTKDFDTETNEDEVTGSFSITQGQECPIGNILIKDGKTKPPKRYTAGTIIQAMTNITSEDKDLAKILKEVKGIGTPATRATIVDQLTETGLITIEKKNLVPSNEGEALIDMLPKELQGAEYTALMESKLDQIQEGVLEPIDVVKETEDFLRKVIANKEIKIVFDKSYPCPICGNGYLIYKKYKKEINKQNELVRYFRCTECNKTINAMPDKNEPDYVPCPNCKTGYIKEKRISTGKNAGKTFYGCSNFPECKQSYPSEKEYRKIADEYAKKRATAPSAIENAFS